MARKAQYAFIPGMISHTVGGKREMLVLGAEVAVVENVDAVRILWRTTTSRLVIFRKEERRLNCTGIVLLNVAVVLDTLVAIRRIRFLRIQKRARRKSDGNQDIEGISLSAILLLSL